MANLHEAFLTEQRESFADEHGSDYQTRKIGNGINVSQDPEHMFECRHLEESVVREFYKVGDSVIPAFRAGSANDPRIRTAGSAVWAPDQQTFDYVNTWVTLDEVPYSGKLRILSKSELEIFNDGTCFSIYKPGMDGIWYGESIAKHAGVLTLNTRIGHDLKVGLKYNLDDPTNTFLSSLILQTHNSYLFETQTKKLQMKHGEPTIGIEFSDVIRLFRFQGNVEGEIKIDEEADYEFDDLGTKVMFNVSKDFVDIVSYKYGTTEVDSITRIPRSQPMERMLNHRTEWVNRFVWEDQLIPEPLRQDAAQPYSDNLDQVWLRANVRGLLGIQERKINKPIA